MIPMLSPVSRLTCRIDNRAAAMVLDAPSRILVCDSNTLIAINFQTGAINVLIGKTQGLIARDNRKNKRSIDAAIFFRIHIPHEAAEPVIGRFVHNTRLHGILMYAAQNDHQVRIILHRLAFAPALEGMPDPVVLRVVPIYEFAPDALHYAG